MFSFYSSNLQNASTNQKFIIIGDTDTERHTKISCQNRLFNIINKINASFYSNNLQKVSTNKKKICDTDTMIQTIN